MIDTTAPVLKFFDLVKPFHTKVLEHITTYRFTERIDCKVRDKSEMNVSLLAGLPAKVHYDVMQGYFGKTYDGGTTSSFMFENGWDVKPFDTIAWDGATPWDAWSAMQGSPEHTIFTSMKYANSASINMMATDQVDVYVCDIGFPLGWSDGIHGWDICGWDAFNHNGMLGRQNGVRAMPLDTHITEIFEIIPI